MAEQVQAILDGMVAPLRDLEERGVFSPDEIRAIVERRRGSEYALRRRQARKADFIEYLEHEINLEKLRDLRAKRQKRLQQQRSDYMSRAEGNFIGDKHIRSHIHLIWTRTLRKFRSDMAVYLMYADYLTETKNYNKLSLLYAQALQLFPRAEGLWIRAASHEFFVAGNIQSARVLLQRGLRINVAAADLWVQSFVLEMHVVQKLQGRQAILNGDKQDEERPDVASDKIDADHPLALAKLVYDHAIKKIPNNVAFRLRFVEQLGLFPDTEALAAHIIMSMTSDCGDQPEAWIAKAMYARNQRDDNGSPSHKRQRKEHAALVVTDSVLLVLQEATRNLATTEMYTKAIRYIDDYLTDDETAQQEANQLAKDFMKQASDAGLLSSDLVLAYADLVGDNDKERSVEAIKMFLGNTKQAPAAVWLRLAASAETTEDAVAILERAIRETSIAESDHMVLLLQLLGAKATIDDASGQDLLRIQERIVYLAPGFADLVDIEDISFGVRNVMDACRQSLDRIWRLDGLGAARKAYSNVLFQSGIAKLYTTRHADVVKAYIDAAIVIEMKCQDVADRRRRLSRLFTSASELFAGTDIAKDFHARSQIEWRAIHANAIWGVDNVLSGSLAVPIVDVSSLEFSADAFAETYNVFHLVLVRNVSRAKTGDVLSWQSLAPVFASLDEDDKITWCVETIADESNVTPATFLAEGSCSSRAYCSFLIQNDATALDGTLKKLPVAELDFIKNCHYENALWVFFGRNPRDSGADLDGRPEHTDSVSHDGTWHYQLSGSKTWTLRASPSMRRQLNQHFAGGWDENKRLTVTVEQDDVLVLNTRLWFHQTTIPPQDNPSVSYARDFCFASTGLSAVKDAHMVNTDGLYATADIEEGTILFRESDMPSCELHRASSADASNCQLVELEDGSSAVVSSRKIAAGEFFCIPDSDDDADDDEVDDDEEAEDGSGQEQESELDEASADVDEDV